MEGGVGESGVWRKSIAWMRVGEILGGDTSPPSPVVDAYGCMYYVDHTRVYGSEAER